MPKNPKVSVVIPTLNEGKYIEPTLFHLRRLKPYEIIVADSHSEDDTVKIAKKYGAKVVYAKRGAASFGRNAGGRAAKGDILLFLDADTIVFPNIFDEIRRDFREKKLVVWTCSVYGFSPSWKEQVIYNMSNELVQFLSKYMKKPHAPGICLAVRKNAFTKVGGFNENLKVMEDHEFAMTAGKLGKYKFSSNTCVFTSTRRMDQWGSWGLIKKYSKIYIKYFLNRKKFYNSVSKIQYEAIR